MPCTELVELNNDNIILNAMSRGRVLVIHGNTAKLVAYLDRPNTLPKELAVEVHVAKELAVRLASVPEYGELQAIGWRESIGSVGEGGEVYSLWA